MAMVVIENGITMENVDRPLGPVVVDIAGTSLTDEEVKFFRIRWSEW